MPSERFVCVHGHFYQPPRENPWLEAIEVQDSAAPYHDWNERIQAECYAPMGACRIRRDFVGPVTRIVNNYRDISFNFGPTLLSWMEQADPQGYEQILVADRESMDRRSGHGNAIAQAYNHMIMPLASEHDLRTQVFWGLADFTHRFSRQPEGMWLPETAVDVRTLRALAEAGVRFTVLAPRQAAAVRPLAARAVLERRARRRREPHDEGWVDVSGGAVDPTVPYWCDLGGGQGITLFFYDGPISGAVAFEGLLRDGRLLANRLLGALRDHEGHQLVHIATDGETYGHHHRFGEMALAAALRAIDASGEAELTNYGEFLERYPPTHEVRIVEPSAWSCAHGVGRWSADCGCSAGTPGYHQRWRAPLREALDYLKHGLDQVFEREGGRLLQDPWAARDAYVWVLLNKSSRFRDEFLGDHARPEVTEREARGVWKLLEMQRHGMLMYTSCGWFFDELSGIEGVQILRYAARALQLAEQLGGDLRAGFEERLAAAPSNVPALGDGRAVLRRAVLPSSVDPDRILARHAIASVLDPPEGATRIFCYTIEPKDFVRETFGSSSVAVGRVRLVTETTQEEHYASFAVLYFGEHDFSCKVHRFDSIQDYDRAKKHILDAFRSHSIKETILAMEEGFPGTEHDIRDLFVEERRQLVRRVLRGSLSKLRDSYEGIFRDNQKLMGFLTEVAIPMPEELAITARYVLRRRLADACEELEEVVGAGDTSQILQRIEETLTEARSLDLEVSLARLALSVQRRLEREASHLADEREFGNVEVCLWLADLIQSWKLDVRTWKAENDIFRFLTGPVQRLQDRVRFGEVGFADRVEAALALGRAMGFDA